MFIIGCNTNTCILGPTIASKDISDDTAIMGMHTKSYNSVVLNGGAYAVVIEFESRLS